MEHVRAGRVDRALSAVLRQLPAKVGGAFVGAVSAKVSINPGKDALRGFNGLLRGAFGRGAVRNQDDAGRVVFSRGAKGHVNVRAKLQVPSLKLRVIEFLERFHISGEAVDACAVPQRMGEGHKALPQYLAPGGAGGVAGVDVSAHGAGGVT